MRSTHQDQTVGITVGAPTDADFIQTPSDGTCCMDATDNKIYVRIGGTWKAVTEGLRPPSLSLRSKRPSRSCRRSLERSRLERTDQSRADRGLRQDRSARHLRAVARRSGAPRVPGAQAQPFEVFADVVGRFEHSVSSGLVVRSSGSTLDSEGGDPRGAGLAARRCSARCQSATLGARFKGALLEMSHRLGIVCGHDYRHFRD